MTATTPGSLPRAVLFDWDNTLIDNWGCIHAALNAALVAMGQDPWSYQETLVRVRHSLRDSFPRMFGPRWPEAREIFYNHYAGHHLTGVEALPGAAELLARLNALGIYVAVVSNKTGRFLRAEVALLGWEAWFGQLIGAGDAEADKPAEAPVALALTPAGLVPGHFKPEHVWFVGDAAIDMECAHRTGCWPVLVGPGHDEALNKYPPALHIPDCTAFSELLARICDTIPLPVADSRPNAPTAA